MGRFIIMMVLDFIVGVIACWWLEFVSWPFTEKKIKKIDSWNKVAQKQILKELLKSLVYLLLVANGFIMLAFIGYVLTPRIFPNNEYGILPMMVGMFIVQKLKHHLIIRKYTPLARAIFGNSKTFRRIIETGIDVNEPNIDGRSALIISVARSQIKNVRLLIESGADLNAIDQDGNTALMWASYHGNLGILQLLIDAGAEINAMNKKGETALDTGHNKRAVSLLIQHGAKKGSELP